MGDGRLLHDALCVFERFQSVLRFLEYPSGRRVNRRIMAQPRTGGHIAPRLARYACLSAALGLAACAGIRQEIHSDGEHGMSDVTLTQEDQRKSVVLQPGATLAVRLRENPSTGFRWRLEQSDDAILAPLESRYAQDAATIGGGGTHVWRF